MRGNRYHDYALSLKGHEGIRLARNGDSKSSPSDTTY